MLVHLQSLLMNSTLEPLYLVNNETHWITALNDSTAANLGVTMSFFYGIVAFFALWAVWLQLNSAFRTAGSMVFYLLVATACLTRCTWFGIGKEAFSINHIPRAIFSWEHDWVPIFISNVMETIGSLLIYSIFLLMTVSWANLLQGVYEGDRVDSTPTVLFVTSILIVFSLHLANYILFLLGRYTSLWMICYDAIVLVVLSIISIVAISIYSHRILTVLEACSDMTRLQSKGRLSSVIRTTIICNIFLVLNFAFELVQVISIMEYGKMDMIIKENWWWAYLFIKHFLEIITLALLLITLWGPAKQALKEGYDEIPGSSSEEEEEMSPRKISL